MKPIKTYFQFAIQKGASDIHLVGGEKPTIRVEGKLAAFQQHELSGEELEKEVFSLMSDDQKARFQESLELDMSHDVDGVRFRVNIHRQQEQIGLAARLVPNIIPTPDEIDFEDVAKKLTSFQNGLILVVGPTGHGKSTTIASMIEQINQTRKAHIVTIEDPIEFVFEDKKSLIEQREVGTDTHTFAEALKRVLRQDPDIILVGEMRDPETIATVLTAAETGHLVFSTLHTSTAADTIERIVDVFEGAKQKQALIQLGSVLRGVVAQQLLPTVDGKRVAAREVLYNTPAVGNLIRENNIGQINSVIQTNIRKGMISMEKSVRALLEKGVIDEEVAKAYLENVS